MNTIELNIHNKTLEKLGYEPNHIYWEENKGYTSDLIKRLKDFTITKEGSLYVIKDGDRVVATGGTWVTCLFNLAAGLR